MQRWGYRSQTREDGRYRLPGVLGQVGAAAQPQPPPGRPRHRRVRRHPRPSGDLVPPPAALYALQKVVADLGHCDPPVRPGRNNAPGIEGTHPSWAAWVQRWYDTSTLTPKVRAIIRTLMAKAGRWLAEQHPEITEPSKWIRSTCAAWVAAVDRMNVGDYVQRRDHLHARHGAPISPRTKAHILMASRTFFRDCQEWEWFPRRFDPARALAVPRSVAALIGTDPRVIADHVWAKLMWAGLHLQAEDLPGTSATTYYPLALIRALTLTWLFSGLRSDEITRLRVGCIRWQHHGHPIAGDAPDVLAGDAVCLLDVPVNKTGTAFTKPVEPIVGQAIDAWQALRPQQPQRPDRKTGEHVDLLFSIRAHPVANNYINRSIIPALCAKAGIPSADIRGKITSHRARSTIATQLYNAKEPMTPFELQAWLGHRSPQHHPALREDHPEHAHQGLHPGRLLRPQRPHHRGPHRP
jgi:integrase